ncbi:unnamed protein product [Sphagnum balticum]
MSTTRSVVHTVVCVLVVIAHTCRGQSQSRDVYEHEKTKWNTDKPSPNVKMKLSIGGMNHVRRAALNVINEAIPNLSGFKATVRRADGASITIDKGRVKRVHACSTHSYSVSGGFIGVRGGITLPGLIFGVTEGVTMAMNITMSRPNNGSLVFTVNDCQATAKFTNLTISPTGPLASAVGPYLVCRLRRHTHL